MTYQAADLRRIAHAGKLEFSTVSANRHQFEAAALWYRLDYSAPKRIAPSQLVRRLRRVARHAQSLLNALGIVDPSKALDGPQDFALMNALASVDGGSERQVLQASERIGRLAEILEAVTAAANFSEMAAAAERDIATVGALTVRPGHQGKVPLNNWIAAMMVLYRDLTGREPATSVGAPDRPNEGVANGPLIRFLAAAGKPLGVKQTSDAWRERIRLILDQSSDSSN